MARLSTMTGPNLTGVCENGSLVPRLSSCELPGRVLIVIGGIPLVFDKI